MEQPDRKSWRIGAAATIGAAMAAVAIAPVAAGDPDGPDTAGPEIELETPAEGGVYERGSQLRADFECRDESDVRLCIATVPDGERIRTDRLGEFGFRVVGLDGVGNWSSVTVRYRVVDEIEPPDEPSDDPPPDDAPPPEAPPPPEDPPPPEEPPQEGAPTEPAVAAAAPPAITP
ncbi:MAG: hypothetical protein ACR2O6_15330, partial [Ilumatobacteraceae bacterium]